FAVVLSFVLHCGTASAQAVEVTEETAVDGTTTRSSEPARPQVGQEAARKYFKARQSTSSPQRHIAAAGNRYMALQIGTFVSEDVYRWGRGGKKDPGQLNA